jgi:hypothetical protein
MTSTGSSTVYHIDVQDDHSRILANAYGSLKVIALVAKEAAEEITGAGPYSVTLTEVESIGGNARRAVLSLTADGDIVTTVLKQRLTSERKNGQEAPATEEPAVRMHEEGMEPAVLDNIGTQNNTHVI